MADWVKPEVTWLIRTSVECHAGPQNRITQNSPIWGLQSIQHQYDTLARLSPTLYQIKIRRGVPGTS